MRAWRGDTDGRATRTTHTCTHMHTPTHTQSDTHERTAESDIEHPSDQQAPIYRFHTSTLAPLHFFLLLVLLLDRWWW